MRTEFDIKLAAKDMYRFSIHHAYTGSQGIISIVLAALSFFAAVKTYGSVAMSYTVLYAVFGVLFLFYMPLNLYLRSKRQFLMSKELQAPLHYVIDETGIHTSQKDATADLPWEQVYKLVSTKSGIFVYSNRVNAYIIPKNQIEGQYEAFREIAEAHLPKYRYKMK